MHIQFDILDTDRARKKVMISMGTMWRKFKTNLTTKWTLAEDKNEDETPCDKYGIDPKN